MFETNGAQKAINMVKSTIEGLGLNPDENRIQTDENSTGWQIRRGSADVMIMVNEGEDDRPARLRIVSPIVSFRRKPPSSLLKKLLQLNATAMPGIWFGIHGEEIVVLVAERSVIGLDKVEVVELIETMGFFADKYDDLLVNRFGGTRVCDLK